MGSKMANLWKKGTKTQYLSSSPSIKKKDKVGLEEYRTVPSLLFFLKPIFTILGILVPILTSSLLTHPSNFSCFGCSYLLMVSIYMYPIKIIYLHVIFHSKLYRYRGGGGLVQSNIRLLVKVEMNSFHFCMKHPLLTVIRFFQSANLKWKKETQLGIRLCT